MGTVAMGDVWLVGREYDDGQQWECQGAFSTQAKAIAACRTPDDAVIHFEIDRDMTDIKDPAAFDVFYPLRQT